MLHAASPSPGRGTEVAGARRGQPRRHAGTVRAVPELGVRLTARWRHAVRDLPACDSTAWYSAAWYSAAWYSAVSGRCLRPPLSMSSTRPPGARDERHDDPRFRRGAARRRGPVLRQAALARAAARPGLGPARPVRPAAVTAVLYLLNLSRNGYANDFYAAAVQAGTRSWKAFFFGSFDSSSFITVDKTPASLWVDEIAARIFGFSSWTLLAPQAIEGVASVLLLYAAVRRWFGPAAGLIAGRRARADPGGRADVPVQQPGRAAGAADDRRRRTACSGRSSGTGPAGWCWPGCCSASRS